MAVTAPNPTNEDRQAALLASLTKNGRANWWRRLGDKENGFRYENAKGVPITDARHLERIAHLAIPPGYKEVRVAPTASSRLQAVAIDAADRLQYRYHAEHTAAQSAKKYSKVERFGEVLPRLRRASNEHIAHSGLSKERVLAVVVKLINDLYFRLGSEGSVARYKTFGVTTLRNQHLTIESDGTLLFQFVGKHHIPQRRILVDEHLAETLRELKQLRGPRLFQYQDAHGSIHAITPADVNHYIKQAIGADFSAKDFRTWGGTLLAAVSLAEIGVVPDEEAQADVHKARHIAHTAHHDEETKPHLTPAQRKIQHNIVEAARQVADRLGNTPTVCRECYIHPVVFDKYAQGITLDDFREKTRRHIRRTQPDYEPEEIALLKLFHDSQNLNPNPSAPDA